MKNFTQFCTVVVITLVIIAVFMLLPQNTGQGSYTADVLSTAYPFPTQVYPNITPTYFDYDAWVQTAYPVMQITEITQVPTAPPAFNEMKRDTNKNELSASAPTETPTETIEAVKPLRKHFNLWKRFTNSLRQLFLSWR